MRSLLHKALSGKTAGLSLFAFLFACLWSFFLCGGLAAQVSTGDIVGTVMDSSNALVPEARVSVTNTGTGQVRVLMSSSAGEFVAPLLEPGDYSVMVEAKGFKIYRTVHLVLSAGQRLRSDVALQAGDVTTTVEVSANSESSLQTDTSTVQSAVSATAVRDLPLNGRNFINLVQLQPGANTGTPSAKSQGTGVDDRRQTSTVTANGQSDMLNNQLVDGLDNNEREQGFLGVRPSIDAIAEVRIFTSNYPAEVGRAGGAVINVLTKAGTNRFHGSLFEFFRNDVFDAKNFFARTGGKPEYRLNQFGGSLGGPILRDKTFFFVAAEELRAIQGVTYTQTVPTLFQEQNPGNFSDIGGPVLTPSQLSATSLNFFKLYPAPNQAGVVVGGVPTSNFVSSPKETQFGTTVDARIDHHFNENNSFFAHYGYNPVTTFVPGGLPGISIFGKTVYSAGGASLPGPSNTTAQGISLGYLHIFSPNLIMELKTGYTRVNIQSQPLNYGSNLASQFGVINSNLGTAETSAVPFMQFATYASLGDGNFVPISDVNNTFQYNGTVTYSRGKHSMKFGAALIRRELNYAQQQFSPQGGFEFTNTGSYTNALENFLTGSAAYAYRGNLTIKPGFRSWEPSFFAQDDWRVTPFLTLNLGVRYGIITPFTEAHNLYPNFDLSTVSIQLAGQGLSDTANVKTKYTNVAPRVGFALTLPGSAVLRGGFGIAYFPTDFQGVVTNVNPPYGYVCNPCNTTTYPTLPLPVASAANPSGALSYKDPDFGPANVKQYNVAFERQIGPNTVNLSYVGSVTRRLVFPTDINRPAAPGAGNPTPSYIFAAQLPNVTNIRWYPNEGYANYNSLQASVQRQLSHGLTTSANYTWAHGLSNTVIGLNGSGFVGNISSNPGYDYGNSLLDIRNRIAVSATYRLPFGDSLRGVPGILGRGWQFNLLSYWQTGLPFTITNGQTITGTMANGQKVKGIARINIPGLTSDRPDQIASANVSNPTITRWFNTAAFAPQTIGTAGNERNFQVYGPHERRADMSLFKDVSIYHEAVLQFRAECFNVSNTPNFSNPNATLGNATIGQITSTRTGENPRQWQFALKASF